MAQGLPTQPPYLSCLPPTKSLSPALHYSMEMSLPPPLDVCVCVRAYVALHIYERNYWHCIVDAARHCISVSTRALCIELCSVKTLRSGSEIQTAALYNTSCDTQKLHESGQTCRMLYNRLLFLAGPIAVQWIPICMENG